MVEVTKALVSAFNIFGTFMEYLSKKYRNNEALKKITEWAISTFSSYCEAISTFSSYCEAQISKSPVAEEKSKGGETLEIPPFS